MQIFEQVYETYSYLLEEVSCTFSLGALESTVLEELENISSWTVVHDLPFCHQDHIIKEIERFWGRLKKGNQCGGFREMHKMLNTRNDLESGGTV